MKKFFVLFISIVTFIVCFSMVVSAEEIVYRGSVGELSWEFNTTDQTLTIKGEGNIKDFTVETSDWNHFESSVKSVVIEKGVTGIGEYAFYGYKNLKSVIIADSVTSIGACAFSNCTSLEEVIIPNSVTRIGDMAFYQCSSLKNIVIPNSVTEINGGAFWRCTGLVSVTIGDSVQVIEVFAFSDCDSLESVYILSQNIMEASDFNKDFLSLVKNIIVPKGAEVNDSINDSFTNVENVKIDGVEYTVYSDHKHVYDNTCDGECNLCILKKTPADHVYENGCDTKCNVCEAERTIEHTYDNACDGVCNICEAARTPSDHVYDNACDKKCNVCEAERDIQHTYDNVCDTKCNVCEAERTIEHTYDNACDGVCNICEATRTPSSHVWDEGAVTKESTKEEEGVKTYACTVCGETKTEPVPKLTGCGGGGGAMIALLSNSAILLVWFALKKKH